MIEVELLDGTIVEFPDGTPQETMQQALVAQFGAGNADNTEEKASILKAIQGGIVSGATLGFADELYGGLFALPEAGIQALQGQDFDLAKGYASARDKYRGQQKKAQQDRPVTSTVAEIGGALAGPGLSGIKAIGNALKSSSAGQRAITSGLVAGGEGAAYGFGSAEGGFGNRAQNAALSGAISGGIGTFAPIVGSKLQKFASNKLQNRAAKQMVREAPSTDTLREASKDLFAKADKVEGLDRDILSKAFANINDKAQRQGLDDVLTPQSARALNRVEDAATNPAPTTGFRELDVLRRQAQIPASNQSNRVEQAIGSGLVDDIDDVISQAAPDVGGDVAQARELWGRLRRSEIVEALIAKGEDAASGAENGIRNQFRSLIHSPKAKGFSPDEIEAFRRVANGTASGNRLKKVGKYGVGSEQQSNAIGAAISAATGQAVAGPVGAVGFPLTGTIAQKLGERSTRKNADFAKALVASGGKLPKPQLTQEQRLLIEALQRRGARSVEAVR